MPKKKTDRRRLDVPGSPYFEIAAVPDGWPVLGFKQPAVHREKDCHKCGAVRTGGTCERCLNELRKRALDQKPIFD